MEIQPRFDSKRKPMLQNTSSTQYVQFGELLMTVNQLSVQNRKKYDQIMESKPYFKYQLYKVNENKSISVNFGRQLLMKQLDKLMEEEHFLNRELSLITIQQEEDNQTQQDMVQRQTNPFQVLKSIWASGSKNYDSAIDHADSLNHILGHIKLTIRKITDLQRDNSPEQHHQYLQTVKQLYQEGSNCQKCEAQQQSKKQLRAKIATLEDQLTSLADTNRNLQEQIARKDDSLRKLNKKIIELQTEAQSKIMYLQEKLLMEDHQIKQLKKFKNELEKNMFKGEHYQLFIKTQEDLAYLDKSLTIELEELVSFLVNNSDNSLPLHSESQGKIHEGKPELQEEILPQLTLPLGRTENPKKAYHTQRPKTERRLASMTQNMIRLEQLQTVGKKYMRTNQLTTKRNRQMPTTPIESKHTISTLKLSQSPKSIEQH